MSFGASDELMIEYPATMRVRDPLSFNVDQRCIHFVQCPPSLILQLEVYACAGFSSANVWLLASFRFYSSHNHLGRNEQIVKHS